VGRIALFYFLSRKLDKNQKQAQKNIFMWGVKVTFSQVELARQNLENKNCLF